MFLSRLILNGSSRQVRRDLADCQELHRTILRAFPAATGEGRARAEFEVLHRLETDSSRGRLTLYVQSAEPPDWSWLTQTDYLVPTDDPERPNPAVKRIDAAYGRLEAGTILRFRLRANPTRKVGTMLKADRVAGKEKANGRRVPLVKLEDQVGWLQRKGAAGGFELLTVRAEGKVPDLSTGSEASEEGRRPVRSRGQEGAAAWDRLRFRGVLFEGRLRVTDRARFLETLRKGIGSGKAYGFGLVSIARGE